MPEQREWIGVVLSTLGDHIRKIEDENRELKAMLEQLTRLERFRGNDPEDRRATRDDTVQRLLDERGDDGGEGDRDGT